MQTVLLQNLTIVIIRGMLNNTRDIEYSVLISLIQNTLAVGGGVNVLQVRILCGGVKHNH